jgi:hypothetical protein
MATTTPKLAEALISPAKLIGRDEMNLAEFPSALVADRAEVGQKTLYFEDEHGRLTVTGSDAYGLPTASDTDVIVALIYLTKLRNNFKDIKVNFSRYELIKLLNWRDDGDSYKRLDQSLNRWHGVSLIYDGCWWNNRLKCYTDMKLHIIEEVEIVKGDARRAARLAGQIELPLSSLEWSKKFIESCQADNLRQLNLDEYFSLKSAIAKRLYRFLGKRFYLQGDWTFDLNEIAFDRVGLSRGYEGNAGKIKAKLHPAIEELESIGFLHPLSREKRYRRIDRGHWTIRLARHSPVLVTLQPPATPEASPPPLVAELTKRGITAKSADELVKQHQAESIQAKIDVFDWMMEKQDKRVAKSPEGYLVKSITDDYKTPKGFVSAADRQKQAEAKQARERKDAEDRRRKQQEDAIEQGKQKRDVAYWAQLTPEEQAQLQAKADASVDAQELAKQARPLRELGQGMRRREYIRRMLDEQEQATKA